VALAWDSIEPENSDRPDLAFDAATLAAVTPSALFQNRGGLSDNRPGGKEDQP
jgi:hypothetical protein